jgi:hypothetical protein
MELSSVLTTHCLQGVFAMSRARCLFAFFALVLSASLVQADGLLCDLPKDGSWVTYDADVNATGPGGMNMTIKGTFNLASVGEATEGGEPCRWIEVEFKLAMVMGDRKNEKTEVYKLLIPEKYLAKGESPLEHVVRAWVKRDKSEPVKLDNPNDIDAGPLPLVLAAAWKNAKDLEQTEVECKLGKVACKGTEGTLEFKNKRGGTMKCKLEKRLHPDSPFGVASSRWNIELPEMGEGSGMTWNIKLADFGKDAKSKMPDAK